MYRLDYFSDMGKKLLPVLLIAAAFLSMTCCGGNGSNAKDGWEGDSVLNALSDRVVTIGDVDEATTAVRTAFREGEITQPQKKYLDAMIVYRSLLRFDSVVSICNGIVDLPEVKADSFFSYRIYALMTNAALSGGSYAEMVKYASRTADYAHKLGRTNKEHEMRGIVGYGMVLCGHGVEGLQKIDNAMAAISQSKDWKWRNSYIILGKVKIASLYHMKRTAEILDVGADIIRRIDDMTQHPDGVTNLPPGWKRDQKAFAMAFDLYRSQALAYMAYAYAKKGKREEALKCVADFDRTMFAQTYDGKSCIVLALAELKLYDKMLQAYADIDAAAGGDTLTEEYREELRNKSRAAEDMGQTAYSRQLLHRYVALDDTLAKLRDRQQMAQMLSLYRVHEEQMKANDADAAARTLMVVVAALLLLVTMVVVFAVRIFIQSSQMKAKNTALARTIEEAYSYRDKYEQLLRDTSAAADNAAPEAEPDAVDAAADREANGDERLFAFIDRAIREKKMYLDADFQRQTLVDTLHVDRNRIGKAVKDYSGFPNLSAYINSFRLEHAYRLLRSNDARMTVDSVSRESGFTTVRTFQRLFKERYGMTPAELRASVKG